MRDDEQYEASDRPDEAEGGKKADGRETNAPFAARELTPEEHERFRRSSRNIRDSVVRPYSEYAFSKRALFLRPQFGNLAETLNRLTGANGAYKQLARLVLPTNQRQGIWPRNMGIVNSDIAKLLSAPQRKSQLIFKQLAKNFGIDEVGKSTKLAEQMRSLQASWFTNIAPNLEKLKAAFWPPNLRNIERLSFNDVEAVVMFDGIGLYNVPRQSIATALIRANSVQERREILGRRWKSISSDCRQALGACKSETLHGYVTPTIAALDALDDGHTQAAQALVGSITDALLIDYLGGERRLYTPNKQTKNSDAYKKFGIRKYIALAPMWQTYQQFWVKNGDAVPGTFNRNATAHTVSGRQFNRRNAIQGLLFVCGLITFLEELLQRRP